MKPHTKGFLMRGLLAAALCAAPLLSGCYNDVVSEPPSERGGLLPVAGAYNVRDLGIYKTTDGKKIKSGKLIRSGELNMLTGRDQDYLFGDLGIKTVVDFRGKNAKTGVDDKGTPDDTSDDIPIATPSERDLAQSRVLDGVNILYKDTAIEESMVIGSYEDVIKDPNIADAPAAVALMANGYKNLLNQGKGQFREFFDILLASNGDPVLFHCSAGKDRTGVATILLLTALGVDKEVIREDYMSSAAFVEEKYHPVPAFVAKATAEGMKAQRDSEDVKGLAAALKSGDANTIAGVKLSMRPSVEAGIRDGIIASVKAGFVDDGMPMNTVNAMTEAELDTALQTAQQPTIEQRYQGFLLMNGGDAYITASVDGQCLSLQSLAVMSNEYIDTFAEGAKKKVTELVTVKQEYFNAVYDAAGGNVMDYLTNVLGLTSENIATLKELYLEN